MTDQKNDPSGSLPDMLLPNVHYAITINPSDDKQYHSEKDKRLEKIYQYLRRAHLLQWAKYDIYFKLFPEITLPAHPKKTRIHFHGTIFFKSIQGITKWYLHFYDRMGSSNNVHISPISNKDTWRSYVQKNKVIMKPMAKRFQLPYMIENKTLNKF